MKRILLLAILALLPLVARAETKKPAKEEFFVLEFPAFTNPKDFTITYCVQGKTGSFISEAKIVDGRCAVNVFGAQDFRAVVLSPKYQAVLVRALDLPKDPLRKVAIRPKPLGAVPFVGKIDLPKGGKATDFRLEVVFYWDRGMGFLNYLDGQPPRLLAATVDLDGGGSFKTTIPDFAHDPEVSLDGKIDDLGFPLMVILRQKSTGNMPYELKMSGANGPDGYLKIRADYGEMDWRAVPKTR